MAKTTKITADTQITINPKTKSKTYEFTQNAELTITTETQGAYSDMYYNFGTRVGDNLVITTLFTKESGKTKSVKTVVKNYFTDDTKEYSVKYKSCVENYDPQNLHITPATQPSNEGLYGSGVSDAWYYLMDENEPIDSTHTINGAFGKLYFDPKGNDKFINDNCTAIVYTYDLAGNDEYTATSGYPMYTHDWAGNDIYSASGENTRLYMEDFAGKDEYTVSDGANFQIFETKGNDTYLIKENGEANPTSDFKNHINEYAGNDTYTLDNAKAYAFDFAGRDTYNVTGDATLTTIHDNAGNDKYNFLAATSDDHSSAEGGFYLEEDTGKDTYNIAGLVYGEDATDDYDIYDKAGNDKYNFQKYTATAKDGTKTTYDLLAQNIHIGDEKGNDKYTINVADNLDGADSITISDKAGKDTYKATGSGTNAVSYLTVKDSDVKSADKYNFNLVTDFMITDEGGKDSYTIKKSTGDIVDNGIGNDSYNIETLNGSANAISIYDAGGKKDKLTLSEWSKDDVVFMANIASDGTYYDNSLIAFNKTNMSYVYIDDFFNFGGDGNIDGFSGGRIETIKVGKTTIKDINKASRYTYYNEIKATVAGWLASETPYGSVGQLMNASADAADGLKGILATFFPNPDKYGNYGQVG